MKISTTILSATLLAGALALAGCGGSGNGAMDDDMDMDSGPTAEERAEAAEAKLAAKEKAEAEAKAAADAKAALEMARTLYGVLMNTGDTSLINPADDTKDANDEQNSMSISVMGKAFSKEYADNTSPAVSSVSTTDGKHKLTLAQVTTGDANIMGSAFSTSAPETHKQDRVNADTRDIYFSTPGSYHGVAGTYECMASTADGCKSRLAPSGKGIVLTGTWTFTPSDKNAPVSAADGVKWGWWLEKDKNVTEKAHVYYEAGTSGLAAVEAGLPTDHGGKATYMGDAIGQYSVYGGANGKNDSGAFQADATLQATFGGSAAISGTIDNFMGADGMPRMWSVELMKSSDVGTGGVISGGKVIWTMDGAKGNEAGEWQVSAYAPGGDNMVDPSAVAGAFKAEHDTNRGLMIGAFGAEKQ